MPSVFKAGQLEDSSNFPNSQNSFYMSSGFIPRPLSIICTLSFYSPVSQLVLTRTGLPQENLRAFLIRLTRTCFNRRWSPISEGGSESNSSSSCSSVAYISSGLQSFLTVSKIIGAFIIQDYYLKIPATNLNVSLGLKGSSRFTKRSWSIILRSKISLTKHKRRFICEIIIKIMFRCA